jgi:hypothetical protein
LNFARKLLGTIFSCYPIWIIRALINFVFYLSATQRMAMVCYKNNFGFACEYSPKENQTKKTHNYF